MLRLRAMEAPDPEEVVATPEELAAEKANFLKSGISVLYCGGKEILLYSCRFMNTLLVIVLYTHVVVCSLLLLFPTYFVGLYP